MTRLPAILPARLPGADAALLGRWADHRDDAAFTELVRRHGPAVWGVCRRQLANPADAEDAFQAAFLVLARRCHPAPACLGAWLHRVAVLTCRNVRRANRRRPSVALPSDIAVSPAAPTLDVDDLLDRLPERDRRAVVLCHLLGFTRAEAARQLGIPEGTLSARLSRGLAKLRGGEALVVVAVPAGLARAVGQMSAAGPSPAAAGAAAGVLRMVWLKKLTAVAAVAAAGLVTTGVGVGLGGAAVADPPTAAGLPADWKATAELEWAGVKAAVRLTARVEKGWLVARCDAPAGRKVWEVVLAQATDSTPPRVTADPNGIGLAVEYGRYFVRDEAASQLRVLRQRKTADSPAWPVVRPDEDGRAHARTAGLHLRAGKEWLWVAAGPFADDHFDRPDAARTDVCLRLDHLKRDGGRHGSGRVTGTAGRTNAADHGDTHATDDGELFVAGYNPNPPDPPGKPAPPAKLPRLAGRWAVYEADSDYSVGPLDLVANLTETAVAGVEGDAKWQPGEFTQDGRRVRFTVTRGDDRRRVEVVRDPARSDRMPGSVWDGSSVHRVLLVRLADGQEPPFAQRPTVPPARQQWLDLTIKAHQTVSAATAPGRKDKPAAEQAELVAAAVAAQNEYTAAEPRLLRQLVAAEPRTVSGFSAARELITLAARRDRDWSARLNENLGTPPGTVRDISRVEATEDEVRAWVTVARGFAATQGPQLEAGVLTRVAGELSRQGQYLTLAAELAADADQLAVAAGLPPTAVGAVGNEQTEADAWATQPNPPAAGRVWTVTVRGRVTDGAGKPVAGATIRLTNFQGTEVLFTDDGYQVTTDADGRYTTTVRCRGQRRVHLTGLWAEAKGFGKAMDRERRPLLPGEKATVDFVLTPD